MRRKRLSRTQKRLTEWILAVKKLERGFPLVRTSEGLIVPWDRERIVKALLAETRLAKELLGMEAMGKEEAEELAKRVEKRIRSLDLPFVSSPLVREMLNNVLLELSKKNPIYAVYRNLMSRVGVPVWDYYEITQRRGFEALENANLQPNPETVAKKLSDSVAKQANLLLLPPKLAEAHLAGDLHIHDLEYLTIRPFCMDYDLRFFLRYGLLADGTGQRTSVAKAAKHPTVAILHAVKILAAGQVCSSGGQGLYNFNIFLAPYLRGLDYEQIRQMAQCFIFELNESVDGRTLLPILNDDEFSIVEMQGYAEKILERNKSFEEGGRKIVYSPKFKVLVYDPLVKRVRFEDATALIRHEKRRDHLLEIVGRSGRRCKVTKFHSIFTLDEEGFLRPVRAETLKPGDWFVVVQAIPSSPTRIELDLIQLMLKKLPRRCLRRVWVEGKIKPLLEGLGGKRKRIAKKLGVTAKCIEGWIRRNRMPLWVLKCLAKPRGKLRLTSAFKRRPSLPSKLRVDSELAWLLGLYLAEGCVSPSHRDLGVIISTSNERIRMRIARIVRRIFGSALTIEHASVRFGGALATFLFNEVLGLGERATKKQVSWVAYHWPQDLISSFLRGYHEGDGCVSKDSIIYVTHSRKLANSLAYLLQIHGMFPIIEQNEIRSNFVRSKRKGYRVVILGKRDLMRFRRLVRDFRDRDKLVLAPSWGREIKRRVLLFPRLREILKSKGYGNAYKVKSVTTDTIKKYLDEEEIEGVGDLKAFVDGQLITEEIKEVKRVGYDGYVYDIEVLGVQNFVGGLGGVLFHNTYVSRGGQLPFTSVQLEAGIPRIWRSVPVVTRGRIGPDVYGDYEEEAKLFMKAFLEIMLEGDAWGKMFIWPKPEVRLRRAWFQGDAELMRLASQLSAKFGTTYYDNVIPAYRGGEDSVDCYQCCAFRLVDNLGEAFQRKLFFEDGEHFSMGGLQVITINLPRLAYLANGDDSLLFERLAEVMEKARDLLLLKRRLVLKQAERNLLPFLTQRIRLDGQLSPPLCDLENLSMIIGFVGVNELCQFHTGMQLHESSDAVRFGLRTIVEMERIKDEFVKQTGLPFVIARTPAESCAARLAVLDLIHFNEKARTVVKGNLEGWKKRFDEGGFTNVPVYYTNGFMVSYDAPIDLFRKIRIEEKVFPTLSGGDIFHIFLGEAHPDPEAMHKLNEKIATKTQIGYYSYTKDLTVCNSCRKIAALLHEACPTCGSKDVEWYSRITGYYNAVSGWNEAKKEELKRRYRLRREMLFGFASD